MSGTKYVPADLFEQAVKGGRAIGGETNFPAVKIGDTTLTAAGQLLHLGVDLSAYYPADGVASSVNRQCGLEVNADTGGNDLNGDVYVAAIKGNFVLDTTSTNASIVGVLGMLNSNTAGYGSGDHYAVRGHVDFWGSSAVDGANNNIGGVSAYVEHESTTTIASGNYVCGLQAYQVGSPTISSGGMNPAIWIRGNVGWQKGIHVSTTGLIANADFLYFDAEIAGVVQKDSESPLVDIHGTANAGYIRVSIATDVRYIALYAAKTS